MFVIFSLLNISEHHCTTPACQCGSLFVEKLPAAYISMFLWEDYMYIGTIHPEGKSYCHRQQAIKSFHDKVWNFILLIYKAV
jgi:hypothetical protein